MQDDQASKHTKINVEANAEEVTLSYDDLANTLTHNVLVQQPPPTYSPPQAVSGGNVGQFKSKPTNHLYLSNDQSAIHGEFVIDPTIRIPTTLLPPLTDLASEDDRKNLYLRSRDGSVRADIHLLAGSQTDRPRRTTIALVSNHGSIQSQVRTVDGTVPFALTATAPHGSIKLGLPRGFTGLLRLSTRHGGITLSSALLQHSTQLGQVGDVRQYFVGDFELLGDTTWEGAEVEAEAVHGSVRVRYVDEGVDAQNEFKGLFRRFFSGS